MVKNKDMDNVIKFLTAQMEGYLRAARTCKRNAKKWKDNEKFKKEDEQLAKKNADLGEEFRLAIEKLKK